MSRIEVEYDGEYPCACSGTLTITIDGKQIYSKKYCTRSTGSVWFDEEWGDHVEDGDLLWNDGEIDKIPREYDDIKKKIKSKVESVLSEVDVCCGGCV